MTDRGPLHLWRGHSHGIGLIPQSKERGQRRPLRQPPDLRRVISDLFVSHTLGPNQPTAYNYDKNLAPATLQERSKGT